MAIYSIPHTVTCLHYKGVFHLGFHMWYTVNGEITIYGIPDMVIFLWYIEQSHLDLHIWYTVYR